MHAVTSFGSVSQTAMKGLQGTLNAQWRRPPVLESQNVLQFLENDECERVLELILLGYFNNEASWNTSSIQ